MHLLALDSSGKTASVCLLRDGTVLHEALLDKGLTHSETLLPLVRQVLADAGLAVSGVDVLAVTGGPGSFTGLRIGMALAKGLALPDNIPALAVSTLRSLAIASGQSGLVLPALDARRGEVYWAAFSCQPGVCRRLAPDDAAPASAAAAWLSALPAGDSPVFWVGDGAQICYNALEPAKAQSSLAALRYPIARGTALAAYAAWQRGEAVPAAALRPRYLRLSQAERERAKSGI